MKNKQKENIQGGGCKVVDQETQAVMENYQAFLYLIQLDLQNLIIFQIEIGN